MNGPEHYTKAERLLAQIAELTSKTQEAEDAGITMSPSMIETVRSSIALTAARAQVHATLALAAATASPLVDKYMGDSDLVTDWGHTIGWVVPAEIAEDHDGRERTWPEMVDAQGCGAVSDSDVRCGKPAGHTDHHKGTSTDEHGEPMFSRWSNTEADGV